MTHTRGTQVNRAAIAGEARPSWSTRARGYRDEAEPLRPVARDVHRGPGKTGLEDLRTPQPRACPFLRFRHVKFVFHLVWAVTRGCRVPISKRLTVATSAWG